MIFFKLLKYFFNMFIEENTHTSGLAQFKPAQFKGHCIAYSHMCVLVSQIPFPSPGNLPNPGIKPRFPALQADSLPSESPGKPQVTLISEPK